MFSIFNKRKNESEAGGSKKKKEEEASDEYKPPTYEAIPSKESLRKQCGLFQLKYGYAKRKAGITCLAPAKRYHKTGRYHTLTW